MRDLTDLILSLTFIIGGILFLSFFFIFQFPLGYEGWKERMIEVDNPNDRGIEGMTYYLVPSVSIIFILLGLLFAGYCAKMEKEE